MKKTSYIFLVLSVACSCLLFSGCNQFSFLYRGDKSLITYVSIDYPHLDVNKAILSDEDQNTFINHLEKTKRVKLEKPAAFSPRVFSENPFAFVKVNGNSNDVGKVGFFVYSDGKVEVKGEVADSWYDSQLNKECMDIILKYQFNNFNPSENLKYYGIGNAKKLVDSDITSEENKTYFITDKKDELIVAKFFETLTIISSIKMPKQQIVDSLSQILPTNIVDETYAFTLNFKPAPARPENKSTYFCGIVATDKMIRIVVERKISEKTEYILSDYEMDGLAIKDSIKKLAM